MPADAGVTSPPPPSPNPLLSFVPASPLQDLLKVSATLDDARLIITSLAKMHALWHGPARIDDASIAFVPRVQCR